MKESYRTIKGEGTAEIVEKKSRFIANVKKVTTEEEALDFYEFYKKKYWDAKHNVYAYYINSETTVQKFTDDGEPTGTAGMPVLETIKKLQLQDVAIVITRYFGGILLGTGGLARAYSKAALEGINKVGIVEKILSVKYCFKIEYTMLGKIQASSNEKGWKITDIIYAEQIEIHIAVPLSKTEEFLKIIKEISSGSVEPKEIDKDYYIMEEINL